MQGRQEAKRTLENEDKFLVSVYRLHCRMLNVYNFMQVFLPFYVTSYFFNIFFQFIEKY